MWRYDLKKDETDIAQEKKNIFVNVYESKSTQASENLYLNFH